MSVYLLWGDEEFNIESALKDLRANILDSSFGSINHKVLKDPSLISILEAVETTPMMFGNMLVEIHTSTLFVRGKADDYTQKLTDRLLNVLETLNPALNIAFVCEFDKTASKKIDSAKKIVKTIEKIGQVQHFPAFKSYEDSKIVEWIKKRAKLKNVQIANDSAALLFTQVGIDLRKLDTELDKLVIYVSPKNEISKHDIQKLCPNTENIFRMTDFWLLDKKSQALQELKVLFDRNVPVRIIATMQSLIKRWLRIKLESKVKSSDEIAKIIGLHPFVVEQDLKKLKNISSDYLVDMRKRLNKAESDIKTGKMQPELALEMVIAL